MWDVMKKRWVLSLEEVEAIYLADCRELDARYDWFERVGILAPMEDEEGLSQSGVKVSYDRRRKSGADKRQ